MRAGAVGVDSSLDSDLAVEIEEEGLFKVS